ncbi:MAG: DMT family transporter [Rhizobiales bacterium]|nr:DMT family transporter [Hyphomicrobiales bacterium]
MNRAFLLLLGTGASFGLNFPIGKLAIAAGVSPVLWAALICAGAGISMGVVTAISGALFEKSGPVTRYAFVSGFLSNVVPHFLTFSAIPKIGSGLASIMFALSPVTTALLSLILRVRPPRPLGLAGIAVGLAGALVIIIARNADFDATGSFWLMLSALIPVFLAMGNVYRSLGWPAGATPIRLAALTNLAAVPPLLVGLWLLTGSLDVTPLAAIPGLVAIQLVVSTIMFLMLFRLQQLGGPTYLSQIGYVGAVVGVGIGVTVLGETYPLAVWVGAAIVAAGVALTTWAQMRAV